MAVLARRRNRATRRREWLAQLRLRASLERDFMRRLAAEITRTGRAAATGYQRSGKRGAQGPIAGHRARVRKLLDAHYKRVFAAFGNRFFDEVKSTGIRETKATNSEFVRARDRWLRRHGARKVKQISDTTLSHILGAVLTGEEAGEGVAVIAERIRGRTGGVIARARAQVIARTETHGAANAASEASVRALGLEDELRREWINAEDNRTRSSHRQQPEGAGGQIRGMDEPFDVGGVKLMFPGDPDANAPEETIGCRCVVGFLTPAP